MRNQLGIWAEVWAENAGDNSAIPTGIDLGFTPSYAVDLSPDRRNMNDILAKVSAVAIDINKYGATLPWDIGLTYEPFGSILGSDGTIYISQIQNTGKDPTIVGNRPTFWRTLSEVLGITSLKTDTEYIGITGGTHDLFKNIQGTWVYQIDDFVGGGIDTNEIRTIWIDAFTEVTSTGASGRETKITITYPDGSTKTLKKSVANNSDNDNGGSALLPVPINSGQTSFTISTTTNGQGSQNGISFKIEGATQRKV